MSVSKTALSLAWKSSSGESRARDVSAKALNAPGNIPFRRDFKEGDDDEDLAERNTLTPVTSASKG